MIELCGGQRPAAPTPKEQNMDDDDIDDNDDDYDDDDYYYTSSRLALTTYHVQRVPTQGHRDIDTDSLLK